MAPSALPRTPALPSDGALLRCDVGVDAWAEHLPPVPDGHDVSVSLSEADMLDLHAEPLRRLGYRVVGLVVPARAHFPVADVLVTAHVAAAHPDWYRALAAMAHRSYDLRMGPVLASLSTVVRAHLEVR